MVQAIMLAAGLGRRLHANSQQSSPKVLLPFLNQTLLSRHITLLRAISATKLTIVTGHGREQVGAELTRIAPSGWWQTIHNEDFHLGSLVSAHCALSKLHPDQDVLLMDGDVLYDQRILAKLAAGAGGLAALPFDRHYEDGPEPVRIYRLGKRIVEFAKNPDPIPDHHDSGEWIGFLWMSRHGAKILANIIADRVAKGEHDIPVEVAIRDFVLSSAEITGVNVTGLPWIEIDFPHDIERAHRDIVPQLQPLPAVTPI